jgi:hypothetical protein
VLEDDGEMTGLQLTYEEALLVKRTLENAVGSKLEKDVMRFAAEQHVEACSDEDRPHWRDRYMALDNDIRLLDNIINRLEGFELAANAVIIAHEEIYGRQ